MPARRRDQRVPGDLSVIVGMHVNPAGGGHGTIGGNFAFAGPSAAADLSERAAVDGDVARIGIRARPVDDFRIANDQIMHHRTLQFPHKCAK